MCKICADSVREYFPEVPDDKYGDFLTNCTAFPMAEGKHVREQLEEHVKTMKAFHVTDWRWLYGWCVTELDIGMDVYRRNCEIAEIVNKRYNFKTKYYDKNGRKLY